MDGRAIAMEEIEARLRDGSVHTDNTGGGSALRYPDTLEPMSVGDGVMCELPSRNGGTHLVRCTLMYFYKGTNPIVSPLRGSGMYVMSEPYALQKVRHWRHR